MRSLNWSSHLTVIFATLWMFHKEENVYHGSQSYQDYNTKDPGLEIQAKRHFQDYYSLSLEKQKKNKPIVFLKSVYKPIQNPFINRWISLYKPMHRFIGENE